MDGLTLVPPFTPPLRGRLVVTGLGSIDLLEDMIDLFGGIRFRSMTLFDVVGMQLLLNACAGTLETFKLYPSDPRGKELPPFSVRIVTEDFEAMSSLQDFDLSRNKLLRTLLVPASSIDDTLIDSPPGTASNTLKYVLSTITSPTFFTFMVIYYHDDFRGVEYQGRSDWPAFREMSEVDRTEEASWHHRRFEVLREVRKARDFDLVLCAGVWESMREYAVGALKQAVAEERAKKGFEDFRSEPSVTYHLERVRDPDPTSH